MPQDHSSLPALSNQTGVETYRASTNAAELCGAIVKATALTIQGRKYVRAEGWQAIAVAHGCTASAGGVEFVSGGCKAIGQVRRMSDGVVIAEAEGFVGEDEPTWYGGNARGKMLPKRPDFAIRAMAQTRAISRACRSAFAHVVVMIDKDLGTTPAEEMQGVMDHEPDSITNGQNRSMSNAAEEIAAQTGNAKSTYQINKEKKEAEKRAAAEAKVKSWVDGALATIALSGQTRETLQEFWKTNGTQIDWMEANMPDEHERFVVAFDKAMDGALAQVAA